MGKFHKARVKIVPESNKFFFDVCVRIHGKNPHTETYSINIWDVEKAQELGYFNSDFVNTVYLDWKPLFTTGDISGGIKKVDKYKFDDKYVYAYTKHNIYSLPKYLFKDVKNKKYILFGERET